LKLQHHRNTTYFYNHVDLNMSDQNSPEQSPNPPEQVDILIDRDHGRRYWEGVEATVDGMLGGFPHVSRVDLQGSKNFLAKLGFGNKPGKRVAQTALEGGAGYDYPPFKKWSRSI